LVRPIDDIRHIGSVKGLVMRIKCQRVFEPDG
jgi:hypothetical protein